VVEEALSGEMERATIQCQVAEVLVVVELVIKPLAAREPRENLVKEIPVATAPQELGSPVEVVVRQVLAARPLAQAEVQVVRVEP
jgi:hypothetical protein